ncbi:MAG TPA: UPF0175 family protein [Thermoanaerobaculia bacterium]|nr:UPF0175 family protein [Thermoanaerobaculia bacterium]
MTLTLEVPEDLAAKLEASWRDLSSAILEVLAVEAYIRGDLSSEEVQRLLQLTPRETTILLEHRDLLSDISADDPTAARKEAGVRRTLSPIQKRTLERMKKGWDFGGAPYPTREELRPGSLPSLMKTVRTRRKGPAS